MKFLLFSALLTLASLGCKTTNQYYTPQSFEGAQLKFGNGGGFTGAVTTYILLENGQLFGMEPTKSDTIHIPRLDQKLTDQLFSSYHDMGMDKATHNDPGNLYYFLEVQNEGEPHRIVWGGLEDINPTIPQYYLNLMKLVKRQKATTATQ